MPRRAPANKRAKGKPAARQVVPAVAPPPGESPRKRGHVPRKVSTLVRAIFAENDPVEVATNQLNGEGDATGGRLFLQLLEYLYGKPLQPIEAREPEEQKVAFQFISNIPRPKYPPAVPGPIASAANAPGPAAPATVFASRSNGSESTQEDRHE
jgi:hypothetical protein